MSEPIGNRRIFQKLPGGGYGFTMLDDAVRVEVRHLRREKHTLTGEVDVLCEWAGAATFEGSLSSADMNLSSQTARTQRAKYCAQRAKSRPGDFDWEGLIDEACRRVIQAERGGDELIVLDDAPTNPDRDFNVHGLTIPADAASMLIAHGDSLKSLLLLFVAGTLAQRGHSVLYLDFEWTADRHLARKRRLFGDERIDGLKYMTCRGPLTLEGDRIRRLCDLHQVDLIVGDSVGLACDGKLADDDTAIRFHRTLTHLPPSLWAAHIPKSAINPEAKTDAPVGAFGSVFFTNLCRTTWAVKKEVGIDENLISVGCFPQKQNDGHRYRPVALEFTFTPDRIEFRAVNPIEVDGLADRLPLTARIPHYLKEQGPSTYAAVADALGAKLNSVIQASKRISSVTRETSHDGIVRLALVKRQAYGNQ